MSLTFPYSAEYEPPAPVLTIQVSVPRGTMAPSAVEELQALCDSGADLTCLPASVIERLRLVEVDEVEIAGFDGPARLKPLYSARLQVAGTYSRIVRVVPTTLGGALLGRDVLNSLHLELDGPNLRLNLP